MPNPGAPAIREVLLAEVRAQAPKTHFDATLQQSSVLSAVAIKLGATQRPDLEEAILTQWSELFRTGLLAWGLNLMNPDPPFFHLTERGRLALENVTRDPSNPAGYMRHLASAAGLGPVALSYLTEGLDCYVAGLVKAAAVMVGAAAERMLLDLRDATVQRLTSLGMSVPKGMSDWRARVVSTALHQFFEHHRTRFAYDLQESFEAYWSAFTYQIRATRNDAGHPSSVEPVTPDTVHASLLIFPELARLVTRLTAWVATELN